MTTRVGAFDRKLSGNIFIIYHMVIRRLEKILRVCEVQIQIFDNSKKHENQHYLSIFEGGYSILLPQTKKRGFFDPPERVMVLWLNRLSWEDFRWYFPNPQCQIVRGVHIWTTPAGQSSVFWKKCVKNYHIFWSKK